MVDSENYRFSYPLVPVDFVGCFTTAKGETKIQFIAKTQRVAICQGWASPIRHLEQMRPSPEGAQSCKIYSFGGNPVFCVKNDS